MNADEFLWVQRYRPRTVADTILPKELKDTFQKFVDDKNIPNLILAGRAGVGKTTIARAMLDEVGADYLIINGSMNGNIDTLRNDIQNFASTMSFSGGRKYIILDEADYLNCLEENERIKLADGTSIALKDMTDEEYNVLSFNMRTREFEADKATVVSRDEKEVFEVELGDGTVVSVTEDHPFIVVNSDGTLSERSIAQDLARYELVKYNDIMNQLKTVKVKAIRSVGKKRVVDLTVHRNHTFVTESGVVVHNCNSTQPALRNFMEEFSKNCGFILTCNFINRIIEPLHSRCSIVNFTIPNTEKARLASQFFKRTCNILEAEGIKYDQKAVAELIQSYFPDWRRTLNELQRYSATGSIDAGILRNQGNETIERVLNMVKAKNFSDVRKWVGDHSDIESATLYRAIYDILPTKLNSTAAIADAIIILAEYEYKEAFVANPEINRMAALTTLMAELNDWK
jgi:DNA polymerase III delta prime subunit